MNTDINIIVATLFEAAADIEKQDKINATARLKQIEDDVAIYICKAREYEGYSVLWQQETTASVKELLNKITRLTLEYEDRISKIAATGSRKNIAVDAINILARDIKGYHNLVSENENIYRNAKGCNADKVRKDAGDKINVYLNTIRNIEKQLAENNQEVAALDVVYTKYLKQVGKLLFLMNELQKEEVVLKRKVNYYLQIHLFCLQVRLVLDNIQFQVHKVRDLVAQLDSEHQSIVHYDPMQQNTLTLKEAILQFGRELEDNLYLATPVKTGFSEKEWMKYLDDDRLLSAITIPGTHDAAAFNLEAEDSNRQSLNIREQLVGGIRYLDIELRKDSGSDHALCAVAGNVPLNLDFETEVLAPCYQFLEVYPTETILIAIKELNGAGIASRVKSIIDKRAGQWYIKNNTVPGLKEIRGKIVLLRRFDGMDIGLDVQGGWPHHSVGDLMHHNVHFHVQDMDDLALLGNDPCSEKIDKYVRNCMEQAAAGALDTIYINNVYAYKSKERPRVFEMAEVSIPSLYEQFRLRDFLRYGIFVMDFPELVPDLIAKIINCNFCNVQSAFSFRAPDNKQAGIVMDGQLFAIPDTGVAESVFGKEWRDKLPQVTFPLHHTEKRIMSAEIVQFSGSTALYLSAQRSGAEKTTLRYITPEMQAAFGLYGSVNLLPERDRDRFDFSILRHRAAMLKLPEAGTVLEIYSFMGVDKCLDHNDKNGLILAASVQQKRQQWKLSAAVEGYVYIESVSKPGHVLDVYQNKTADGSAMCIHPINEGKNQRWKIMPAAREGLFLLIPALTSSSCLDVSGFKIEEGTDIILHTIKASNNSNQLWYFHMLPG